MDYQGLILSNLRAIFSVPCPPISVTSPLPQYSALLLYVRIFHLLSIMDHGLMTLLPPHSLPSASHWDKDSDFWFLQTTLSSRVQWTSPFYKYKKKFFFFLRKLGLPGTHHKECRVSKQTAGLGSNLGFVIISLGHSVQSFYFDLFICQTSMVRVPTSGLGRLNDTCNTLINVIHYLQHLE